MNKPPGGIQSKNECYRRMLQTICENKIRFAYVLNDLWFASTESMRFVKLDLRKEFIIALKSNRKAASSAEDHPSGKYQRIN